MPPQANRRTAPLFATAGTCRRLFDLSPRNLAALRKAGNVHAYKPSPKCWLYRVADILAALEGPGRDEEFAADLAWIEDALTQDTDLAASAADTNRTTRKD